MIVNPKPILPSFPSKPPNPVRPITPIHPIFPGKETLSIGDRLNAMGLRGDLSRELSSLSGKVKLMMAPEQTLRRGPNGQVLGPEGQPLATVRLANGQTAYVDPNTNQYYVAEKSPFINFKAPGTVTVRGPLALPKGAEFSNSHFSEADVAAITRLANGKGPWLSPPLITRDTFER